MAKSKSKSTTSEQNSTKMLAGKSVAFVGKFGYQDMWLSLLHAWVGKRGGTIANPQDMPDYLVFGKGRGGKPPGDVAKVQKKHPEVQTLDMAAFLQSVKPTAEEFLADIRTGELDHKFWENVQQTLRLSGTPLDLQGVDLRGFNLRGAKLDHVNLNGADFRTGNLEYAEIPNVSDAQFDEAAASNVYLHNLEDCSFRRASMEKAWMFYGNSKLATRCDFRDARLANSRIERGTCTDCTFANSDLSDAEIEHSTFSGCDFSKCDMSRLHASSTRFDRVIFAKAKLERADLRNASLVNADLRNVILHDAILAGADLTGANVDGADFKGAVLTGAKIAGLDVSKAKNFTAPAARSAGPKLLEFAASAVGSKSFVTTAGVDLGQGEFAHLHFNLGRWGSSAQSNHHRDGKSVYDRIDAPSFEQALFNLADRWPNATLRLDTITAKGSATLRGKKLQELATAAWAEVFGVTFDPEALKKKEAEQRTETMRQREQLFAEIRSKGSEVWNSIHYQEKDRLDLRGIDLQQAQLQKLQMWGQDLQGGNFTGSNFQDAELWGAKLQKTNFSDCDLTNTRLEHSHLESAQFTNAKLKNTNFSQTKLQGTDFTNTDLASALLEGAQFDQTTKFPTGFTPPETMVWKGDGPRPGTKKVKARKAGSLDFDTFIQNLNNKVELARMQKAGSMLKAERFQLFAEVKDDSIVGVVKSQSSSELVYSCRLAADGAFSCCTQNLRPCGGLRGALCKHLLVLIVGLAKAGQLDSATVDHWINLSRSQKPAIDEDAMSATFLRYKGAEAGEVDWRPTETIPEDFYTM